jgi:hypothetical protein
MQKSLSKNIVIGVLLAIIFWLVFIWFSTPKITDLYVGDPAIFFSDTGNRISINGAWLPPIINSENRSPARTLLTNSDIICDRVKNICQESRATIRFLDDRNMSMNAFMVEYSIKEWDNEFIIATVNWPVRTDELRINRRKKSATLIQTEKNSDTASSQPFIWELVDTDSAIRRFKELYK